MFDVDYILNYETFMNSSFPDKVRIKKLYLRLILDIYSASVNLFVCFKAGFLEFNLRPVENDIKKKNKI